LENINHWIDPKFSILHGKLFFLKKKLINKLFSNCSGSPFCENREEDAVWSLFSTTASLCTEGGSSGGNVALQQLLRKNSVASFS